MRAGRRLVVSGPEFKRVWREEIVPDLELRVGKLELMAEGRSAHAEFLGAFVEILREIEESRSRSEELPSSGAIMASNDERIAAIADDIDWDKIVGATEILCYIARKRCSVR